MVGIQFEGCAEEADCEPLALEMLVFVPGVGTDAILLRTERIQSVKGVRNVQRFFLSCLHGIRVANESTVWGRSEGPRLRKPGAASPLSR